MPLLEVQIGATHTSEDTADNQFALRRNGNWKLTNLERPAGFDQNDRPGRHRHAIAPDFTSGSSSWPVITSGRVSRPTTYSGRGSPSGRGSLVTSL